MRMGYMVAAIVGISLLLSGCTEEKAIALKGAAEAFRDKAVEAIESLKNLHAAELAGNHTDAELRRQAIHALTEAAVETKTITDDQLQGGLDRTHARERALKKQTKLDEVMQAYVEFGGAFARLPEGAAFATDAVGCAAALGARLAHRLVVYHEFLEQNPTPGLRAKSEAAAQIRRAAGAAPANRAEVERAVGAYLDADDAVRVANEQALKKLAQAAEAGDMVLDLANDFGTLSVADLLSGVNRILEIRAKYFGADTATTRQKVANLRQKLESDSKLKPILGVKVAHEIPQCKR